MAAKEEAIKSILRREIAVSLRKKKTPIFSTEQSIDAVIEKLQLKGEAVVGLMIAVNTTLELMAQEIENGSSE